MITISKKSLYLTLVTASVGTAGVALLFPESILAQVLAPVSLLLIMVVPGLLAYLVLAQSSSIYLRTTLYGVGLSASLLMTLGVVVNLTHGVLFTEPIRPLPVWTAFAVLLMGLGLGVKYRVPGETIRIALPSSARPYLLVSVPLAAAVGGLIVEGGGTNLFVVLALALIGLTYIVGAFNASYRAALIYAVALALLLHNTMISEFLLWGDQGKEAKLAYTVLQAGYWNPEALPRANKAIMLRLVMLNPLHTLLTGLEMRHIFKIAHPLLFATAPVALYRTFATRGRDQAGYLAAGTLMFFFSFFTVLSRNTRTAVAILFIVLFIKVLLDTDINARIRRILLAVFGSSVFFSHYGTAYMFLAMLLAGLVFSTIAQRLLGQTNRRSGQLAVETVGIISLVGFAWYAYVSPDATTFGGLTGTVIDFFLRLQEGFFQPSNSATANYAANSFTSLSLNGIKILTVVLFALIGIGWLVAVSRAVRGQDGVETNLSYLAIATAAGGLAAITIGPIERFNTARTIAVSLAVVAPLFPVGVEGIQNAVSHRLSSPDWTTTTALCLAVLLPFFVFSSGLLAATITGEYSPNVLVYQDRVAEEGSPESQSYLYKQTLPDTGASSGAWLNRHGTGTVYGSVWPGTPSPGVIGMPPPTYEYRSNVSAATGSDCIYLSPLSVDAGVIRLPSGHLENEFLQTSELNTSAHSKVYENSGATLYC
jgi:uncharacterized membrane protein